MTRTDDQFDGVRLQSATTKTELDAHIKECTARYVDTKDAIKDLKNAIDQMRQGNAATARAMMALFATMLMGIAGQLIVTLSHH